MKLMLPALLLSLSLGAFAQDDEVLDATSEDEAPEVFIPAHPWDKPIFHRVQLGFIGTKAKYTNENPKYPVLGEESLFLPGVSLGWLSDIVLTKNRNLPLYIELGASLNYQTGSYDGTNEAKPGVRYKWHSRVYSLSMTIPINLSYQFKDFRGVDGLTLAPFAGIYGRFNLVADRSQRTTQENYNTITGKVESVDTKYETKSLRKNDVDGGWMQGRTHIGKLFQLGAQVGVNAFYKRYSFGVQYMYEFIPFAKHSSDPGVTKTPNSVDGYTVMSGTGCDMEISTAHNFAVTVGYIF